MAPTSLHVSSLTIHMPAVGLGIYQSVVNPVKFPPLRGNKRKRDSVALIDDGSSPELCADKRPAKCELTAANLTGNRLSGLFGRGIRH